MKSKFWKSAATLMSIGILMAGCSAENGIVQEPEKPLEKDSQFFINVAIANPGEQTTRGDAGYADNQYESHVGTAAEQTINNILFVFYNSANKYVGDTHITINGRTGKTDDGDEVEVTTGTYPGVDGPDNIASLNMIVPVSVASGSLKPVKVIAYVNPTKQYTTDNDVKRSLEQALGITRELEEVKPCDIHGHNGFTMTNSVYYRNTTSSADEEANEEDRTRPAIAVNIPHGFLVADQAEATSDKVLNIHVERVVAKVQVNKGETVTETGNIIDHAFENGSDGNPIKYTLKFNILGWGISNEERGTFLIKNFRKGGNVSPTGFQTWFSMTNMNKTEADERFGSLTNWNYAPPANNATDDWYNRGYRSFWACSPTYFSGASYPSFSDEYADNRDNYNLIYHSFDEIIAFDENVTTHKKNADGTPVYATYGNSIGNSLYTLEHTMVPEVVSDHQKRAVTCVLVVGQYTLTSDADGGTQTPQTFFVRNGVKTSGESGSWIIPDEESLYKRVLSSGLNTVLFVKEGDKYKKAVWGTGTDTDDTHYITAAEKECFTILHPDKVVTSRYTTGESTESYTPNYTPNRYVSVQLTSKAADKFYLRKGDGQYYQVKSSIGNEATDASLIEANRALYGVLSVEKYHNGYAFFAVPIEHIWGKTDQDGKARARMGENGFDPVLGQYGIVRNHFYQLKINGIEGIGTGIGDPTSPIIPNVDEEKYFVKTELRVMKWRMLPEQNVTLRP